MKQITISIFCLSLFTLSALAQDAPAADNTIKNQRDRSGDTRTSGDQSNSSEDVQLTATIRRAVVKDHSLSATAKNVKIISADGVVTLRGPVQNEAEKTKIAELAQSAAGNAKIDNQLEVKASK
jgi:osmotically-inducible protein OsmY